MYETADLVLAALAIPSTEPLPAAIEYADLYAWPIGCHSPNSCRRNGRCMYVGCKHDGTTAMTSTQSGSGK